MDQLTGDGNIYSPRPEDVLGVAAFAALVFLVLFFGQRHGPSPYILVMFVLLTPSFLVPMLVLKHGQRDNPSSRILIVLRDWLPVILCMVAYENLHDLVHVINPNDRDETLLAMDLWLFRQHPTVWLERFVHPSLTEYLSFSYMTYFFYPVISLGVLAYQRRMRSFHDLTLAMVMTLYLGFIGYIIVPAIGPHYTFASSYTVDLQGYQLSTLLHGIDNLFRVSRDCFPSLHFSLSAVILLMTLKHNRMLFYIYLPFVLSLWFSTVYLRYHYVIDLLAGLPLIVFVVIAAPRINRWWYLSRNCPFRNIRRRAGNGIQRFPASR